MSLDTATLLARIKTMSHEEMAATLTLLEELDTRKRIALAQSDFLAFIAAIDSQYKFGAHLKRLGGLLMQIEHGSKDRIAVSMAPRMGKSLMISVYFPAWYLGKHPDHKVIMASHTSDLAVDMARKVRNLMQSDEYKRIFPGVSIAADAKAAGKWNTTKGGEVYATGVGGALAGRGAHLAVVDDPLSEQDIKSGNTDSLDVVYEWYRTGLRTRLMPGGKIAVLHCLTGDTAVLMADGTETALRDVRPGDMVASYDSGRVRPAKVLGWANQGLDRVYALHMHSGVIIRGNERHPLLVDQDGVRKWVKIRDLKPGMSLVSLKGVHDHLRPKLSPDCASPASLASGITAKTLTRRVAHWATTASGKVRSALRKAATSLRTRMGCAPLAAIKPSTPSARPQAFIIALRSEASRTSKCAMGSLALTTTGCLPSKVESAPSVRNLRTIAIPLRNGACAALPSTIAMKPAESARSCVTSAISSSRRAIAPTFSARPLSTLSVTLDEIERIVYDGEEDVFDIQVEGTETFIANGVVSHNTRWHQRDLIGRLVKDAAMNPDADQFEIFEFPAILTFPNPAYDPENPDAPLEVQKSLWPEQWPLETLLRTKASMPAWQWNAQYMQAPTAQESALIKKDDIRWWPKDTPPACDFIVQAWDTAMTTKERSDYSVCQTWGVWQTEDGVDNVILLNCVRSKVEFPELKKIALQQVLEWQPDALIVEAKASGLPLMDELRRSGIYVQDFSPGKGQDKIARVNSVTDMFSSGQVWFPETRWATEVVDEILAFPSGEHDDMVDAMTLALRRVRQGGLLRLVTDYDDPDPLPYRKRAAYY